MSTNPEDLVAQVDTLDDAVEEQRQALNEALNEVRQRLDEMEGRLERVDRGGKYGEALDIPTLSEYWRSTTEHMAKAEESLKRLELRHNSLTTSHKALATSVSELENSVSELDNNSELLEELQAELRQRHATHTALLNNHADEHQAANECLKELDRRLTEVEGLERRLDSLEASRVGARADRIFLHGVMMDLKIRMGFLEAEQHPTHDAQPGSDPPTVEIRYGSKVTDRLDALENQVGALVHQRLAKRITELEDSVLGAREDRVSLRDSLATLRGRLEAVEAEQHPTHDAQDATGWEKLLSRKDLEVLRAAMTIWLRRKVGGFEAVPVQLCERADLLFAGTDRSEIVSILSKLDQVLD